LEKRKLGKENHEGIGPNNTRLTPYAPLSAKKKQEKENQKGIKHIAFEKPPRVIKFTKKRAGRDRQPIKNS